MSIAKGINRRLDIEVTEKLMKRFWSRVDVGKPDECWEWQAAMRNGYGAIRDNGKLYSSHRVAFVATHGVPDVGLVIGHKCDNRACCNPSHLEAITPGQNNRDAHGRIKFHLNRGEDAPNAVLTEEIVRQIVHMHQEYGLGPRAITRKLGLDIKHRRAVNNVLLGDTWSHVTGIEPRR